MKASDNEKRQDTQDEVAALCVELFFFNETALVSTLLHTVLLRFKLTSSVM